MAKKHPLDEGFGSDALREMMEATAEATRIAIGQAKDFLFSNYEPAEDIREGITLSTPEVFQRLQAHVPDNHYSVADVASWLTESGFRTVDKGNLKLEWMLKRRA